MERSPLNLKDDNNNEKELEGLFEAFGSTFSLQDITSAYHKAGKNADLAAEILYDNHGSTSTSPVFASSEKLIVLESSEPSLGDVCKKPHHTNGKFKASKQKVLPVSGGSVSSIIGKDYVKPVPVLVANGLMGTKPMKLDAREMPASTLWGEQTNLNPSKNDNMQKDMEDFLFKMLGDGFQLDRDVIHKVLDKCGYDIQKSMDKLLDMSAVNSDEGDKCLSKCTEKTVDVYSNSEQPSCQKLCPPLNSYGGGTHDALVLTRERTPQQVKKDDREKEILVALFSGGAADRVEAPRREERAARKPRRFREVVVEPLQDSTFERKAISVDINKNVVDETEEDAYQKLRRDVQEYRTTMKEYFKAAVTAFAIGDHDRANRLMDQGHFLQEKARKADEESRQKIFETKHVDTQDEVTLDLHDHDAKVAIHLLKCHLSTLTGIATIKYLKVILETDEPDNSKGARRRLVMKLLERESIKWSGGGNAGTILIHMHNINRNSLSFAKK